MEGGGPEVLSHPWLRSKFRTSLGSGKTNLAAYREDNFQNLKQPFPEPVPTKPVESLLYG